MTMPTEAISFWRLPKSLALLVASTGFAILWFVLSASASHAAVCTFASAGDNDFNTAANWDCGFVPGATSTAVIPAATSTALSASTTVSGLEIGAGSTVTTTGFDLSMFDSVTSSGSLVAGGNTIRVGNDWDFSGGGSFTAGNGTVIFTTSTPDGTFLHQILVAGPISFNNLTLDTNRFVRPSSAFLYTVNGNLTTMNSATLHLVSGSDLTVVGTFTNGASASFALQNSTNVFTANGTTTNDGTFGSLNSGVLNFNGLFTNNGTIQGAAGETYTMNVNATWTNPGTFNSGSSTVTFAGSGGHTVPALTYYNLNVNPGGSSIALLSGNTTATGNFTHGGSGQLNFGANTLAVQGNYTRSGNLSAGTGTVLINGQGAQTLTTITAYNIVIDKPAGTATCAGTYCWASNSLRIKNGTYNGASLTTMIDGSGSPFIIDTTGTFAPGTGTVEYRNSAAPVSIASTTYNNLAFSGSNTFNVDATTTVSGTTNVGATSILAVGTKILIAVGTITNTGLITENTAGGGKIVHTAESVKITDSSGAEVSSIPLGGNIYVTVQDSNRNLSGTTTETMVVTVTTDATAGSDTQNLTLTETGAATGIFRNTAALPTASTGSVTPNDGTIQLLATGIGTGTYTDNQDAADTASDTTTLNGPAPAGGGGGGGGGGGLGSSGSQALPPVQTQYQSLLQNLQNLGIAVHTLVKLPDDSNPDTQEDTAVYYVGADGKRHAFPHEKVYFTWYENFDGVQLISAEQLATIPLGANVTYKPGVKMVKFTTLAKVYVVEKGGILRWVTSEALAAELYGADWNMKIDDINDAFYANYTFGADVNSTADYSPAAAMASVQFPSDSLQM